METALVSEYPRLFRYAWRLTRNQTDAMDLVQAAMLQALSEAERTRHAVQVGAWLKTVLFRLFVDERRRLARRSRALASLAREEGLADADAPPSWGALTLEDVRQMTALLPPRFREPYELFTFEGFSYERIAEHSALSVKTVGTRINRARLRLRALLVAKGDSTDGALGHARERG